MSVRSSLTWTRRGALSASAMRSERKTARVKHADFSRRAHERRLLGEVPRELRGELRQSRRELRRAKHAAAAARARTASAPAATGATATASPNLEAIAACESGGNPSANTGNGFYGKYQFTAETWAAVGGTGNPAAASEAEQDARAAQLYAQQGSSPWPVCGR